MRYVQRLTHANYFGTFIIFLCATVLISCEWTKDEGTHEVGTATTTPPDFTTQPGTPSPPPVNEPPPPSPTPGPSSPDTRIFPNIDLIVEGGASRTQDSMLHLSLIGSPFIIRLMKIGYTTDCSDGQWEEFVSTAEIPVRPTNDINIVSVQFQDDELISSQCLVRTILHDDQGPQIIFTKYPSGALEQGSRAAITYSVTDASPVTSVTCRLSQLEKPCLSGTNEVDITELPEGTYTFQIDATDELGQSSHQAVSWTVVSTTKHLVQSILINDFKKVDILVVDDNSGSMEFEQTSMANRVSNFLAILQGLDWRIGIATTDPTATVAVNTTDPKILSGKWPRRAPRMCTHMSATDCSYRSIALPVNSISIPLCRRPMLSTV